MQDSITPITTHVQPTEAPAHPEQNTLGVQDAESHVPPQPRFSDLQVGLWTTHKATCGTGITLGEVRNRICHPDQATAELIGRIRAKFREAGGCDRGKAAIRDDKANLACITFSALGTTRKEPSSATGLLCVDIDQLGQDYGRAHSALARDPHIVLGPFQSPSGDGQKAVFRVPVPTGTAAEMRHAHRCNFEAVRNYCRERHRIEIDPAASDLLRLCYISADPSCTLNEQAVELDVERWQPTEESQEQGDDSGASPTGDTQNKIDPEVVEALLMSIPPRPEYSTWLKISAAVRNTLVSDELAISMLKRWSPEEDEGEYAVLLRSSSFSRIGFGTLLHHAREHGFWGVKNMFFYAGKWGYAMKRGDSFIPLPQQDQVKEHLRQYFVREDPKSHVCVLCDIRSHNYVGFIGTIAGHPPGLHEFEGNKLLVTKGPKIIAAAPGDAAFIQDFVRGLLVRDGDETQLIYFLAWLQRARRALVRRRRTQLPALAVVGGIGNGKSLLIHIISQCLGGRSAKAYNSLSGATNFNADLIGAELLICDDDSASKDHRSRLKLAQNTKSLLFNASVRVEAKGKDAFVCAPIQALVLAANDDPQHLRILPELDDTMRDKITILRTFPSPLPPELLTNEELTQQRVLEEVPAFLHWLEEQDYSGYINPATGRLECYWNEGVVADLGALSPETTLLELIYSLDALSERAFDTGYWVGTASDLEALLFEHVRTRFAAQRILSFPTACGVFLGRLANTPHSGVSKAGQTPRTRLQQYRIEASQPNVCEQVRRPFAANV
jgi:hypothetical protein